MKSMWFVELIKIIHCQKVCNVVRVNNLGFDLYSTYLEVSHNFGTPDWPKELVTTPEESIVHAFPVFNTN